MTTTVGKLRNITSSILHTPIGDVYDFFNTYLCTKGIMTHHLPSACRAIIPILKSKIEEKYFTKEWIKEGLDEPITIPDLSEEEKKSFWDSFQQYNSKMWDSIKDKTIIITH